MLIYGSPADAPKLKKLRTSCSHTVCGAYCPPAPPDPPRNLSGTSPEPLPPEPLEPDIPDASIPSEGRSTH